MGKIVNIKGNFFSELITFLWKDVAEQDMLAFSEIKLVLPTNRAINSFKGALEKHFKIACVPRIVSIANIASLYDEAPLVQAPESYRVCVLAGLVREFEGAGVSACFHKAYFLDKLISDFKLRGVDISALDGLVDASFALLWAKTANFLKYIFSSTGTLVAPVDNKVAVLKRNLPDKSAVVIAGVWDVAGIYRDFIVNKIANSERSYLVLGNFIEDDDSGENQFSHPQRVIRELLADVQALKPVDFIEYGQLDNRNLKLVSQSFQKINIANENKLTNVELVEANCQLEEAASIAAIVKEHLHCGRINIVTNDRTLILMIKNILNSLGVDVDDSIGTKLSETPAGVLILKLSLFLCEGDIYLFLDILTHPLVNIASVGKEVVLKLSKRLKEDIGFYVWLVNAVNGKRSEEFALWELSSEEKFLLDIIFRAKSITYASTVHGLFKALLEIAELLVEVREQGMARCLNILKEHLSYLGNFKELLGVDNKEELKALIAHILSREVIRPIRPVANVHIVEILEFALMESDVVILASLNEGNWPGNVLPNPWLNKRMLKELGISNEEVTQNNYLNAFIEAFKVSKVFLTRSLKVGGASTIASRFLTNIWNLLPKSNNYYVYYGKQLLVAGDKVKPERGAWPNPEVVDRPKIISATGLVKLVDNPYAYYVEKVLRLQPWSGFNFSLQHFNSSEFARIRGLLFHRVMEQVLKDNSGRELRVIFDQVVDKLLDPDNKKFPLDEKLNLMLRCATKELIPSWIRLVNSQLAVKYRLLEEFGSLQLTNGVMLAAICDRIDVFNDDSINVIDYKTSTLPTRSLLKDNMQVLAQVHMVTLGGFKSLKPNVFYGSCISLVNLNSCKCIKISFEQIRDRADQRIYEVTDKYLNNKEPFVWQGAVSPSIWLFPYIRYNNMD